MHTCSAAVGSGWCLPSTHPPPRSQWGAPAPSCLAVTSVSCSSCLFHSSGRGSQAVFASQNQSPNVKCPNVSWWLLCRSPFVRNCCGRQVGEFYWPEAQGMRCDGPSQQRHAGLILGCAGSLLVPRPIPAVHAGPIFGLRWVFAGAEGFPSHSARASLVAEHGL